MIETLHGTLNALDQSEINFIFESRNFGHLACHVKDDIYLVPISYVIDEGYIYSHSKPGKKIEMMRQNPNVCVQVEEVNNFFKWKSVIAWGDFEELQGDDAAIAMRMFTKKIEIKNHGAEPSSLEMDFTPQFDSALIYRIKIQRSTGRYENISS
jgi:nitroimidazol reductase NimA-like FMN-containing flavoprotein (pyridoxamine 5'-phosphate oxidase superfamily)